MPLISWPSQLSVGILLWSHAAAFTSSQYRLSHEYSGTNFFDGWDFYSGRDPTGGFVTYYSRSSAQLTGLISASETGPAYMGVNYVDKLPFDNKTGRGDGAGRPSVRIASKEAFTHGLFVGDFDHIPAGICGTWPAFWTLGPNWPYTGEIDIMEGVNQNVKNVMSLHTNETCIIQGNSSVMMGQLENTNCAYYPDYNVGCGATDPRQTSFGVGFNQAGGGVYAMQWTSEYIRIWHWPRAEVPSNLKTKQPDPSSWGLPAAQLAVGNCTVDQHFQSHKIIFDTTFCGEYAGNPYVWKTNDATSCQDSTGLATCDNFVANNPAVFKDAYWSVNYVRVYQLVDPDNTAAGTRYIASEQPMSAATNTYTAPNAVATLNLDVDSLCPQYNFSIISDGKYQYEIACGFDPPGPDRIGDPYYGFQAKSMADCLKGCTYLNEKNGTNTCGGVSHFEKINFCYFKKYIDGDLIYRPGYNQIRLIYYGYPQITDDPRSLADSTLTSVFIETIPMPQTYLPSTTTSTITTTTTASNVPTTTTTTTTSGASLVIPPPMGDNSTSTTSAIPPDYSESVTSGYLNSTRAADIDTSRTMVGSDTSATPVSSDTSASSTASDNPGTIVVTETSATTFTDVSSDQSGTTMTSNPPTTTVVTSTDPEATNAEFYIVFNVGSDARLSKRDIQYLAFDDQGRSILVTDETAAAKFRLDADGNLICNEQYVAIDSSVSPPRFLLSDEQPEIPVSVIVNEDGNVVVQGVNGYCFTPNAELVVSTDSEDLPDGCLSVNPALIATPENPDSTLPTTEFTTQTTTLTMISMEGPTIETLTSVVQVTVPVPTDSPQETVSIPSESVSISDGGDDDSDGSSTTQLEDSTVTFVSSESVAIPPSSSSSSASTQASSSKSLSTAPTPVTINDFVYAGCFGVSATDSVSSISGPFADKAMTNDQCTKLCGEQNAFYAATSGTNCFCGTSEALYASLLTYPDTSCDLPCPGANRDFCGGYVKPNGDVPAVLPRRVNVEKRQSPIFLLSLYNSTLLLGGPGETDIPTTADTGTSSITATPTENSTGTMSAQPTDTDTPLSFPAGAVSYNVTGTNTATVISTTYVDVCHVCPGGLTTKAITITIPHCGCTASYDAEIGYSVSIPSPAVPMLTTTKSCACGHNGAQSTITVTVPHTISIEQLASQLPNMPAPLNEAGNLGAMQSLAPSALNEPDASEDDDHLLDAHNDHHDEWEHTDDEDDLDWDDEHFDEDDDWSDEDYYETNDVPITPVAPGGPTPTGPIYNGAAPASSASLTIPSNTALPTQSIDATAKTNGTFPNQNQNQNPGRIAQFTSTASSLLRFGGDRDASLTDLRFVARVFVGLGVGCLVGVW